MASRTVTRTTHRSQIRPRPDCWQNGADAGVAELADAQDLGSCVLGRESSNLSTRTVYRGTQQLCELTTAL